MQITLIFTEKKTDFTVLLLFQKKTKYFLINFIKKKLIKVIYYNEEKIETKIDCRSTKLQNWKIDRTL